MQRRALVRVGTALGVVILVQALAVFTVLQVERKRSRAGSGWLQSDSLQSQSEAPELELERPDGSPLRLSQLRGQEVLVHFWATWCPPCRDELPALLDVAHDLQSTGELRVILVTVDPDWSPVRRFFGGRIPPEVVMDRMQGASRYGVSVLPETYLVSATGRLTRRFRGSRPWRTPELRALLQRSS